MAIVLGVSTCPPGARRPSCLDASGGAARRSPDPVRHSVFHSGLLFAAKESSSSSRVSDFPGQLGSVHCGMGGWTS